MASTEGPFCVLPFFDFFFGECKDFDGRSPLPLVGVEDKGIKNYLPSCHKKTPTPMGAMSSVQRFTSLSFAIYDKLTRVRAEIRDILLLGDACIR